MMLEYYAIDAMHIERFSPAQLTNKMCCQYVVVIGDFVVTHILEITHEVDYVANRT